MAAPFKQKINPEGGIANISGSGSPEGSVIGYVGQTYINTDNNTDLYEKAIGDGTNTGWVQKAGAGASIPNATEIQAGKVELATTLEAQTGSDDTNKAMNPLKTKQAFDAFFPQKFDTLFSGAISGGTFTTSKTLSQIISDYKVLVISFTTNIHRSATAIPTQDLAISVTYEFAKFDTRYVNLDTPSSLSSAVFSYTTGVVTVSNVVVIGF